MEIRLLTEHDVDEFVRLRHEALTHEPYAFGRAPEDAPAWPPESVGSRLRAVPEGNFLVGAFEGSQMVGQAGFIRYEGRKEHHKGNIWGVYVTAAARGQGVAKGEEPFESIAHVRLGRVTPDPSRQPTRCSARLNAQ